MKKNKDIFHSCKCTGQNFTFEEWGKLEDRPKIVHKYKDFGFNIYDVCLTPNVKIKWANKTNHFEVATAQSDNGRWDFGLHYIYFLYARRKIAHYKEVFNPRQLELFDL